MIIIITIIVISIKISLLLLCCKTWRYKKIFCCLFLVYFAEKYI